MRSILYPFCMLFIILLAGLTIKAQTPTYASDYLEKVTEGQQQITEDFLSYTCAIAHGRTAKKIEKRRKQLITDVEQARARLRSMRGFDGDTTLKTAAYTYYTVCYNLLNNDYAKIVDMEEIAEESYDNMETYLMTQEKADEKLHQSFASWDTTMRAFAAGNNIRILDEKSKLSEKSEEAGKVNKYYHQVYLVFFKSYKQDVYLTKAVNKKDINGIEQNKNTLLKNAAEGLQNLSKIHSFEDDPDLINVCRKALQFYEHEAKTSIPIISDYLVKSDNFDKLKTAMNSSSNHSKEDVDNYNKAVNDINNAVAAYNKLNKEDNDARNKVIEEWDNGGLTFLNKHTPHYSKLLDGGSAKK